MNEHAKAERILRENVRRINEQLRPRPNVAEMPRFRAAGAGFDLSGRHTPPPPQTGLKSHSGPSRFDQKLAEAETNAETIDAYVALYARGDLSKLIGVSAELCDDTAKSVRWLIEQIDGLRDDVKAAEREVDRLWAIRHCRSESARSFFVRMEADPVEFLREAFSDDLNGYANLPPYTSDAVYRVLRMLEDGAITRSGVMAGPPVNEGTPTYTDAQREAAFAFMTTGANYQPDPVDSWKYAMIDAIAEALGMRRAGE